MSDSFLNEEELEDILDQIKELTLTKNEALYLSDSITLLMEHEQVPGLVHIPARHLSAHAVVPVPVDIIQKIGMAVLLVTDPDNTSGETTIELSVADLYLLRECCQSYVRINKELVGYNLARKVYALLLDGLVKEKIFLETITETAEEDLDYTDIRSFEQVKDRYLNYLDQEESEVKDDRTI
tara:strand:- start:1492 stop:2037 length:546 start_codon:yes stop_codon:yes gene_type:complete